MASPIEATPTLYGDDALRLLADMENRCSPEEARRRQVAAKRARRAMTGPSTQPAPGVPAVMAVNTETMRLPRRYWTVVVHYAAYDYDHNGDHCGFEIYNPDGSLIWRRDHDGRRVALYAFLDGIAAEREEDIPIREVSISDIRGVGDSDGPPDIDPVISEDWYTAGEYGPE